MISAIVSAGNDIIARHGQGDADNIRTTGVPMKKATPIDPEAQVGKCLTCPKRDTCKN